MDFIIIIGVIILVILVIGLLILRLKKISKKYPVYKTGFLISQNIWRRYNHRNMKVGFIASRVEGDKVYVGFSLCDFKKDEFNEGFAGNSAYARTHHLKEKLPHSLVKEINEFINDRCMRFYKQCYTFPIISKEEDGYYLINPN